VEGVAGDAESKRTVTQFGGLHPRLVPRAFGKKGTGSESSRCLSPFCPNARSEPHAETKGVTAVPPNRNTWGSNRLWQAIR
jgi:hypothetical protein